MHDPAPAAAVAAPRPELPALTGLRGCAAVWVVLFHFHATRAADWGVGEVLRHGYLAVDLFFVLSGFLMVRSYGGLFSGRVRPAAYGVFLTRRLARVYPVYLLVTLGFIGLSALGYTGSDKPVTPVLVALNLAMMQTWFTNVSYCIPGWSISTEFAAYLVFPVLAGPVQRLTPGRTAALLALCAAVLLAVSWLPDAPGGVRRGPLDLAWGSPPWALARCLPDFALGMLAFQASEQAVVRLVLGRPGVGAALLLAFMAALCVPGTDVAAVALMPFVLVHLAGQGAASRVLGTRPALFLGHISYALYLLHYLVPTLMPPVYRHIPAGWPAWGVDACFFGASYAGLLAGGWLMYRRVEVPARRWVRGLVRQAAGGRLRLDTPAPGG